MNERPAPEQLRDLVCAAYDSWLQIRQLARRVGDTAPPPLVLHYSAAELATAAPLRLASVAAALLSDTTITADRIWGPQYTNVGAVCAQALARVHDLVVACGEDPDTIPLPFRNRSREVAAV